MKIHPDGSKEALYELPTSTKNRYRIAEMRNDLLIVDPTLQLYISENNV